MVKPVHNSRPGSTDESKKKVPFGNIRVMPEQKSFAKDWAQKLGLSQSDFLMRGAYVLVREDITACPHCGTLHVIGDEEDREQFPNLHYDAVCRKCGKDFFEEK